MKKKLYVIIIMTLLLTTTVNFVSNSLKADETDSISPEIISTSSEPEDLGFGFDVTFTPNVFDNQSGVNLVKINITYPDNTYGNFTMNNTNGSIYEYLFNNTWQTGQYNYTIWSIDNANNTNMSSQHSFNVSAQADILVCTIKDQYGSNETINLTDPPGEVESDSSSSSQPIGYELLDDKKVLNIWNKYDNYYFNTSSGIQITNHYDEYWSKNVLMLGYYNNNEWNLIYRTDELSGFNKEIESDNVTFVNVTLWKNLNYAGYDFRLAIRYHLGIDDNELTIIPYIKNIDNQDIPYVLGFAWEIKDIQIDMTEENDYIDIDGTSYYLNDSGLYETYTNLDIPSFYIKEDRGVNESKSLYLRWCENLNYKVQIKSRTGQYNAPVTLCIKIGTLDVGQEKFTELFWHDASEVIYYFNDYDTMLAWAVNPAYMVDGNTSNYASTMIDLDMEKLDINLESTADKGAISKVEIRAFGKRSGGGMFPPAIILKAVGGLDVFSPTTTGNWSSWYDITNKPNAPDPWIWNDIDNLIVEVEASVQPSYTLYCSKVDVRVTYNPTPVISNPYPSSGSNGITIAPVLNITVSDLEGDTMNITWLSNSSGSWQSFGTNNSVSNGTYHQTFSNASVNGQWWYWKVNVSDGENTVTSNVFSFYTGCETKIDNNGSTNISGFLLMQVQYYSDLLDKWIVVDDTINENTPRTVNTGGYLALDTIFNGHVNTSKLRYGNGTYRVYVAFRDPNDNVLKCNDDSFLENSYEFEFSSPSFWKNLHLKGFDDPNNIATRGIEVYKDELYIGTWNLNKTKLKANLKDYLGCNGFLAETSITMADDTYKDIEDIEINDQIKAYDIDNSSFVTANVTDICCFTTDIVPDYYITINNKLKISPNHLLFVNGTLTNTSNLENGDLLVDVNGSNVTVNSSIEVFTKKKFYNLIVSVNPEENDIQDNLTYFAEDLQVYPLGIDGYELIGELLLGLIHRKHVNLKIRDVFNIGANSSDGCELWKYNYTTKTWTDLVGRNVSGESDFQPGFNDNRNYVIGAMKEFNSKLYIGTWQSPDIGGEIWRYDGSIWEQIVGPNVTIKGGFNNSDNMMHSMKVFTNSTGATHLYVGTMNWAQGNNGGCQIWRTEDGETWEQVVDRGFRDFNGTTFITRNIYAWSMEEFNDKLFVGTWNSGIVDWGCQLWRTSSGVDDWEKVQLPKNNDTGEFQDGFGERHNYGIRRLVNYSGDLFIGTATSPFQIKWNGNTEIEALEVWKYNGTEGWDAWKCIIGDNSGKKSIWDDGFGDEYNKYCWSMIACNNELWIGTSNNQYDPDPIIPKYKTKGCEVWYYNGEILTASVKDEIGEIGNGFGEEWMIGARSMIEFPENSGNIIVGTYSIKEPFKPKIEELGCEVWIRYS